MSALESRPVEISALVERVIALGGRVVSTQSNGPHELHEMAVGGLGIHLRRDYDRWFVNISARGGEPAPASFWVAAAHGVRTVPDDPTAHRWVVELAELLPTVLEHLATVSATVAEIAAAYRSKLESRLRPPLRHEGS
jgi:hypothetical protein